MELNNPQSGNHLDQQIRLEEIRLLYGSTPFSYMASVTIALIIYVALSGHVVSETSLTIWLFITLSTLIVRSIESYYFSQLDETQQLKNRWRKSFYAGALISGICWGLLPWLAYSSDVVYLSFIIVCIVGVTAGSTSTLSYRWEPMVLFMVATNLLLIFRLLLDNQTFSNITAFLLFVFLLFSLSTGKRIFDNTQQNISLRVDADYRERSMELMHQKQATHLKNTPLAIIEFDLDLNITEWNKSAERIFGYTREEAVGKNIMQLVLTDNSFDEAEKLWQRLLNNEALVGNVVENRTKSGAPIYCEWYVTPLTDSNHKTVAIASMALDITEKKQNELALVNAKEDAEKANQAKSDFLSNMSHELRTPLNAILGFTQLLTYEKTLSDKQRSYINEINNAGSMLFELIDQLLDLARIESGHMQLSMSQVELSALLRECSAMVSPLARQNGISLNIDIDTYGHVIADYTRLKQVILNLLSNAIKYNRDNGSVTLETAQMQNDIIRISVIDTGRGISEELQQHIFQPFYRLYTADDIEGTGIGLSISKHLLEMMNGKIGITSRINEGSRFWIELPGSLDTAMDSKHESNFLLSDTPLADAIASAHKILIAEDNLTNQTLILSQLESLGYSAELADNGEQALNKILETSYELLITDVNMPLINGYELAETLRKQGNDLPIIAITADAFPDTKSKCINAGMNDYIAKPVELAALKQTLEKYLS